MKLKKKSLLVMVAIVVLMAFVVAGCGETAKTATKVEKLEDLSGLKVGVQVGTTADESCQEFLKTSNIKFELTKYDQVIQPFQDMKTGRLDAIVVDEVVGRYYEKLDSKSYKVTGQKLTNEPIGICFKKGNEALRDLVDDTIVGLRKDGTLTKISQQWFGEDLTANVDGAATETTGKGSLPADMKVLRVGVDDVYPPMEYKDDKNTTVGFDIDLANAIGQKLGVKVELVSTAWDGIFTSLNTDKFDCIISSVSINEDRQANFALTKAYIANAQVIVVKP